MPTLFSLPFYDKYYVTFMFLTALVFLSWGTYAEQFSTRKMLWRKNESPVNGLINCYKNAEAHCIVRKSVKVENIWLNIVFHNLESTKNCLTLLKDFVYIFAENKKCKFNAVVKNGLSVRSSFLYCFWINFDENSNLAHKEMRSINFPFPYEDDSSAVMGVKC